jgi:predicted P-loop ATPase
MSTPLPVTKSSNIVNVRMAVTQVFSARLRYNIFTHEPEIDGRTIEPDDLHNIRHDLCAKYEFEASENNIHASTTYVAKLRSYHPVKEFIETVKWDNVSRLDDFFLKYFICEDQPELYLKTVAKYFLLGSVARIYAPGCKVDTMPVIQSTQGWYKSATLKQLFGGFFTDEMGSIQQKDDLIKMTKVWGVEFSELTGLKRADKNHQKQFLTMTEDTVRKPYERLAKSYPRQSVFVGTTNDDEYLTDTDNRRFMPLTLARVDRELLKDDLNQIWAEALHRYKAGEHWWHEREDTAMVEMFAAETRDRQVMSGNGAMFKVKAWLEETRKDFYSNDEIETVIGNWDGPLRDAKPYDVRQVLIKLGFVNTKRYVDVNGRKMQLRGYYKELPPEDFIPRNEKFDAAFNAIFAKENQ